MTAVVNLQFSLVSNLHLNTHTHNRLINAALFASTRQLLQRFLSSSGNNQLYVLSFSAPLLTVHADLRVFMTLVPVFLLSCHRYKIFRVTVRHLHCIALASKTVIEARATFPICYFRRTFSKTTQSNNRDAKQAYPSLLHIPIFFRRSWFQWAHAFDQFLLRMLQRFDHSSHSLIDIDQIVR